MSNLISKEYIYSAISDSLNELAINYPESLSSLAIPNSISLFLFDQIATHNLPKSKVLNVTINVLLNESAQQLIYKSIENLAKKYRFRIIINE